MKIILLAKNVKNLLSNAFSGCFSRIFMNLPRFINDHEAWPRSLNQHATFIVLIFASLSKFLPRKLEMSGKNHKIRRKTYLNGKKLEMWKGAGYC